MADKSVCGSGCSMLPTATRAGLAGKATKWNYIIGAGHAVYLTVINNGSTPVECVGGAWKRMQIRSRITKTAARMEIP